MNNGNNSDIYSVLVEELEKTVSDTQKRIIEDPPDTYIVKHVNFLTKSFLISLCCYLESFLKEIANQHLGSIKQRITSAKVPHNLVIWSLNRDVKYKDSSPQFFDLPITKKDIDEKLSGNPFKTAQFFLLLGVDLNKYPEFLSTKDFINAIVAKRNNIIHHNDSATDITLLDIINYSQKFRKYIETIAHAVHEATSSTS